MNEKRDYVRTEKRQAETIEAVIRLCGENNPSTLTTTDIAKGVNISQGALFKHFPNKGSLWEAVALWMAKQMVDKVFKVSDKYHSPLKGLEAMFLAHVEFVTARPGVPKLMLGELQKSERTRSRIIIDKILNSYRDKVGQVIRAGITAKEVDEHIDVDAASVLYLGTLQGLVIQSLVVSDPPISSQSAAQVFQIYKRGIQSTITPFSVDH